MTLDRSAPDAIRARLTDPDATLAVLGIDSRREGARRWISCPWHADRTPSCVVELRDGVLLARCHACEAGGDVLSLVAAVRGLDLRTDFRRVLEEAAQLAAVDIASPPRSAPRAAAPPRPLPPVDEVRALWDACGPTTADPDVAAWLEGRGLDPVVVDTYRLARALPLGAPVPKWARYRGSAEHARSWADLGYRAIVPMYDHRGELASVRARAIVAPAGDAPKALPPAGFAARGVVMADPLAKIMLATQCWPWDADREVAIAEGEIDFATFATSQREGVRTVAVLGLGGSGQWSDEIADRIPDGSTVAIWTDDDAPGDRYAEQIAASLRGRCDVREGYPEARAARREARRAA